jgi:hypothetical protein
MGTIIKGIQFVLDWLNDVGQWLIDLIMWWPRYVVEQVSDVVVIVISWIGGLVPVDGAAAALGQIPGGVAWALSGLRLDIGIPAVLGAYAIRFLVRRLPVVG